MIQSGKIYTVAALILLSSPSGNSKEIRAETNGTKLVLKLANNSTRYSVEDLHKLTELRRKMSSQLYQDFLKTDDYLIRFLRARGNEVTGAVEMLSKAIKFRKENKMEGIISRDFRKLIRMAPFTIDKGALEGGAILTLTFAHWNIRKIMLSDQQKNINLYIARALEEAEYKIRELNATSEKNIVQGVLIVDMHKFSMREHGCLACIPFYVGLLDIYENIFPQLASQIFILNSPRVFVDFVRNVLRPLMSPHTSKVLEIYGLNRQEYEAALRKAVDPEALTRRYGGVRIN